MQATNAFTFSITCSNGSTVITGRPCNKKSKYHHPLTRLLYLVKLPPPPRPPNEPAVKLNMVAVKAGAKTQKVVPKLRQSRLVLVKETHPTVDEAIRASLRLEEGKRNQGDNGER